MDELIKTVSSIDTSGDLAEHKNLMAIIRSKVHDYLSYNYSFGSAKADISKELLTLLQQLKAICVYRDMDRVSETLDPLIRDRDFAFFAITCMIGHLEKN